MKFLGEYICAKDIPFGFISFSCQPTRTMAASLPSLLSVKAASWDTQQRLPYKPIPKKPKKPQNPNTLSSTTTTTTTTTTSSPPTVTLTTSTTNPIDSSTLSVLLSRNYNQSPSQGKLEETYLGYETWLPSPPKVEKPRSIYNAASLAYIGDSIYELYARRHFLYPPLNIEEFNDRVMAVVRCEAQDAMLQKLLNENHLSAKERDILRWGKNIGSAKTRTKKRVGVAVYNRASSLETLVGYLYLTNVKRLEEIMLKLGFSCSTSPS